MILLGLALVWTLQRGEIVPGVSIEDVEVGGMTAVQARSAIDDTVAARESDPVTFTVADGDDSVTLVPDEVDFTVDVDATLAEAQAVGREGLWPGQALRRVQALWVEENLELVERTDGAALDAWSQEVADELDRDPTPGAVRADPDTLEVTAQPPRRGLVVQVDDLRAAAAAALSQPGPEEVELPAERIPRRVDPDDVERVADQARAALDEPLTLTGAGTSITFEPSQLAPLIGLRERELSETRSTVELVVPSDDVEALFGDDADRFDTAPRSAGFETPRTPPVSFDDQGATTWSPVPASVDVSPSRDGTAFDLDLATEQLNELLRDGVHEAELRLETIEPELTTAEAEDYRITHLLGTFTTYHECCQVRVTNIQRLADVIDGAVVAPGEQFSINEISGERTCSKGYAPAGTIVNGELVDTCGGGVSQFGTTTFNAAFFAGVPLDQWKAHSYYISRYPLGREATLSYPVLDVRFTNDTGNGILVKTDHTSTSVTVSVYGRSDVEQVRATLGDTYNHTAHGTQYRENNDLAPGQSRVVQSGIGGFSVNVRRIIERSGGGSDSRDITTVYAGRPEIIERNTR